MESTDPIQLDLPLIYSAKVLVVDDDAETRDILRVFFSTHDYEVRTASDGTEALRALEDEPDIDVVILDVFIPAVGGLEVLHEIQNLPSRPGVILLTGLADREVARDALRMGAFEYILKPVDLARLRVAVDVCLDHREYLKQSWWDRLVS